MFIRLWETSIKIGDEKTKKFCEDILNIYEKYDINEHIEWKKENKS